MTVPSPFLKRHLSAAFTMVLLLVLAPALLVLRAAPPAQALDNGLARTPPMGWNDWNAFGCNVTEQLVEQTADYLGVSIQSVRRLIARGEVQPVKLTRRILLDRFDLDGLIERRKEPVISRWTLSHHSTRVLT